MLRREAITLIEIIVVVCILGVVIGLLLPAVSAVREAAARTRSAHHLRQISLAVQNFASAHDGMLPSIDGTCPADPRQSLFSSIMPFTESLDAHLERLRLVAPRPVIMLFISPSDPTYDPVNAEQGMCSYPANAQAFSGSRRQGADQPDGTSTTVGFAEHYGGECETGPYLYEKYRRWAIHRATFADSAPPLPGLPLYLPMDVLPVLSPNGRTAASVPGKTFQVAPAVENCDETVAQTPHKAGMITAFMDGSVRLVSPGVSETVFWSLVTPAGGELVDGW